MNSTDAWSQNENASSAPTMEQFLQAFMRYTEQMDERSKAIQSELGLLKREESEEIVDSVKHATFDVGGDPDLSVIQSLLDDESVNDILINGRDAVFVERYGNLEPTDVRFESDEALFKFAQEIVHAVGRRLDPFRPLVDARLKDGSRVNIIAPPLSIDGISISIRKFGRSLHSLDQLAQGTAFSPQVAQFLKYVATSKLNVVISGGTGSGKTTLLNAISQHIRPSDRVVTIEDSAELRLPIPHIVRLESLESDEMGRREVSMRDLVKNALRMRPDRIIVGEVRGPEAFDMIQAMNTGHDGSLTTVHANTPRDALSRLENMIGMANLNIPVASIRRQIASAVNLIVQVSRLDDGSRRIQKITEIVGMEGETVVSQDLFSFKQTGIDNGKIVGQIAWAGIFPRHAELSKTLHESGFMKM